jgi:hypothetical protein
MRPKDWIAALCGVVVVLFGSHLFFDRPPSPEDLAGMSWSVELGKDRCQFVKFNDASTGANSWWIYLGSSPIFISDKLEFRSRKGSSATEFLVSARTGYPKGAPAEHYVDHKVGFDLVNPTHVWPIDDSDWKSAAVLPLTQDVCGLSIPSAILNNPSALEQQKTIKGAPTFECDGREYVKTGKWFGSAVLPPSRAFLALASWNGEFSNGVGQTILFGGPSERNTFIDVFEVATGRKLVTVKLHILGEVGIPFFSAPAWLNGRYLVIPVHEQLRECLICDFGQERHS